MASWKPATEPITARVFQEAMNAHQVVVVHFWADWNAVDQEMDELLSKLRLKFARKAVFYSFDTTPEENHAICRQCGVLNLPALACFIGGRHHETLIGLRSETELEAKLDAWVNHSQSQDDSIV